MPPQRLRSRYGDGADGQPVSQGRPRRWLLDFSVIID